LANLVANKIEGQLGSTQVDMSQTVETPREEIEEAVKTLMAQVGGVINGMEDGLTKIARGVSDTLNRLTESATRYSGSKNCPNVLLFWQD